MTEQHPDQLRDEPDYEQPGQSEPDAVLDERQQQVLSHLRAALRAIPAVPSGLALTLHTRLRTGRLAEAFLLLEDTGSRRWAGNVPFWAALGRAGEMLAVDRSDLTAASRRCQERVTS